MTPTVSVVICAHTLSRYDLTLRCITSALTGSLTPDEVLVVIDNNTTLSRAIEAATHHLPVTLLSNAGLGAAAARTTAIHVARSEIVAFIDDDAIPEHNWLAELIRPFSTQPIVAVGGAIVPDWEPGAALLPPELLWIVGATYRGHPTVPGPISRPIGANMAATRAALLEVGGFPQHFGPRDGVKTSSNEELAVFGKVRQRYGNNSIWYTPDAIVHHFAPAARTRLPYVIKRSWVEGTSKAAALHFVGRGTLRHDRSYLSHTLLPAILTYMVRPSTRADRRFGLLCILSLAVTSSGYVTGYMRNRSQIRKEARV